MPTEQSQAATHPFQAEVAQLLHLMVHAVYTEKEIFLRELISNASDACDKLRYEAIARPELLGDDRLAIEIRPDPIAGTLTVADSGIGMTREELIDNLGTIARSGTRAFIERLASTSEGAGLIGQFGVGFYSVFMIADHVDVVSRRAGEEQAWLWASDGAGGFTVAPAQADGAAPLKRGTAVTLKLKSDARNFLDEHEIARIVKTYSDHILFPIEFAGADGKRRQLNSASALWQRPRSEVKHEEYKEVYQSGAGQYDEPALTIHYRAEGRQSYAVLLFVPTRRPLDLFDPIRKGRIKLYVRRVFITDDADLLPSYLRFLRGVVDSEDVPLNISREMLQNNPVVAQIGRALTARVVGELEGFAARDGTAYEKVWEAFGAVLKEGLYENLERRDQLLKLARFRSTAAPGWRSLEQYCAALRPNQTDIYYLAGEDLDRIKTSPQLEAAEARGIEVLLLTDPIDHFWTAMPVAFAGKQLRSLSHGEVDLSGIPLLGTDQPQEPASAVDMGALLAALKEALRDRVSDVTASKRLVTSPVCLVAPGAGPDRALEKLLARQERGTGLKPILEVNPSHPLVKAIAARAVPGDKAEFADVAQLLLDEAYILEGEPPADPMKFAERANKWILEGLISGQS